MSAPRNRKSTGEKRRSRSLVAEAYQTLKGQISDNRLGPGEQYLEGDLSERLGMSRTPVREALIRLQAEGLVEVSPRHGMRVLPVSPADMEQIYQILTALESAAAERAALRKPSADDLAPIFATREAMEAALEKDDLDAWVRADEAFHKALLNLAGNPRSRGALLQLLGPDPSGTDDDPAAAAEAGLLDQDHRALLNAIKRGDGERARNLHRAHRKAGGEMLVELLKRLNLKGL